MDVPNLYLLRWNKVFFYLACILCCCWSQPVWNFSDIVDVWKLGSLQCWRADLKGACLRMKKDWRPVRSSLMKSIQPHKALYLLGLRGQLAMACLCVCVSGCLYVYSLYRTTAVKWLFQHSQDYLFGKMHELHTQVHTEQQVSTFYLSNFLLLHFSEFPRGLLPWLVSEENFLGGRWQRFLWAQCPSYHPANIIKALKERLNISQLALLAHFEICCCCFYCFFFGAVIALQVKWGFY